MRINRFVASSSGLSRRAADAAIEHGRVLVNGTQPVVGQEVGTSDVVSLDGRTLHLATPQTIILNKPVGYVVSRDGQGSKTIYDLLPPELHHLKPVGRLDKDSSGLLLLTNDGALAHTLTHPSRHKIKIYEIELDTPLQPLHQQMISEHGIQLEDDPSRLQLTRQEEGNGRKWQVSMQEGRNRQIRRTFAALGYDVRHLHRTHFGPYALNGLAPGIYKTVD